MSQALEKNRSQSNIGPYSHEFSKVVDRSTKNWDNILKYNEKSFFFLRKPFLFFFIPCGTFTIEPDQERKADCPREEKTQKNRARTESSCWLRI